MPYSVAETLSMGQNGPSNEHSVIFQIIFCIILILQGSPLKIPH